MPRAYRFHDPNGIYFVTLTLTGWVDLFIRPRYNDLIVDNLKYYQIEQGLRLQAWVIMTSHLHMIVRSTDKPLSDIFRNFKRHTSARLKDMIEDQPGESRKEWLHPLFQNAGLASRKHHAWRLWQDGYHAISLLTDPFYARKLDYIHQNPVKAGYVRQAHHWKYSSAIDYAGGKGLIDIERII